MVKFIALATVVAMSATTWAQGVPAEQAPVEKEWTFINFVNGNNNLDFFTEEDLNQMEAVGSTDRINVVVQWAHYRRPTVTRLLMHKDDNMNEVTSPVVEDIGEVDMGNAQNLKDFIKWSMEKYPAKHYFVSIWNHGSGWRKSRSTVGTWDISFDDRFGTFITTAQLGQALTEVTQETGNKIDVLGMDACLMAMIEVAGEMKDAVDVMIGSQDLEPGSGWPYTELLTEWNNAESATPENVGSILVKTYMESYSNGSQGNESVTQSAVRLSAYPTLVQSIRELGEHLMSLPEKAQIKSAMQATGNFYYSDYKDLKSFVDQLANANISSLDASYLENVRQAVDAMVISNQASADFSFASGISLWIPTNSWTLDSYSSIYEPLNFSLETGWLNVITDIVKYESPAQEAPPTVEPPYAAN